MLDKPTARKIGYKQMLKAITAGLMVAYLIMALLGSPFWIFEFSYTPTLLFASGILYGAGYFLGAYAGQLILINRYPSALVGLIAGLLSIWVATFFGSLIGFFNEGLPNKSPISEPVYDYIFKPLAMVTFWGSIPILVIGILYGISVEHNARRVKKEE